MTFILFSRLYSWLFDYFVSGISSFILRHHHRPRHLSPVVYMARFSGGYKGEQTAKHTSRHIPYLSEVATLLESHQRLSVPPLTLTLLSLFRHRHQCNNILMTKRWFCTHRLISELQLLLRQKRREESQHRAEVRERGKGAKKKQCSP